MTAPQPLADAFPTFTEADWRAAIGRMKRGGNARDTGTPAMEPGPVFQRWAHAQPIVVRSGGEAWRIVQRNDAADEGAAIAALRDDIAGGATGATVALAGSLHPLGGRATTPGIPFAEGLPAGFELRLEPGDLSAVASAFLEVVAERDVALILGFDPIAGLAIRGTAVTDATGDQLRALAQSFDARGLAGAVAVADGRLWHAGGATDEQELGATLATFVALLRLSGATGRIDVALAADADQYRTIAKFRAMRLLLARIGELAGLAASAHRIHAETAWRTMSARDPEMNILRATSASFAAAAGGADSITVLPFDAVGGAGDGHGRRLARNTQVILAEEAHLSLVADPGAGSGAIEAMTAHLAEAAWQQFQAIEAAGGIVAAIGGGGLLREIAAERDARLARVAAGEIEMVGVNAFTGDGDKTPSTVAAPGTDANRLVFRRLSEAFEGHAG